MGIILIVSTTNIVSKGLRFEKNGRVFHQTSGSIVLEPEFEDTIPTFMPHQASAPKPTGRS